MAQMMAVRRTAAGAAGLLRLVPPAVGEHEGKMGERADGSLRGGGLCGDEAERHGIAAYRTLRDVAGEILTSGDLDRALGQCGQLALALLLADACTIALLDEQMGNLMPLLTMASGRSVAVAPLSLDLLDGRMHAAMRAGRSLSVAHGSIIDGLDPLPLSEVQSALTAMLIPLPLGPDLRGVLWVGRIHGEPFGAAEQAFAETIAALIALAIQAVAGR